MTHRIQAQCYVEPKLGLLTGEETSLDVLLEGRVGHDIQGKILEFLECEPDFPGEEPMQSSYIEIYDDLMNREALLVDVEETSCFQENTIYEDDFVICQEFWVKDDDDAFMEEIYQYNNYTF